MDTNKREWARCKTMKTCVYSLDTSSVFEIFTFKVDDQKTLVEILTFIFS